MPPALHVAVSPQLTSRARYAVIVNTQCQCTGSRLTHSSFFDLPFHSVQHSGGDRVARAIFTDGGATPPNAAAYAQQQQQQQYAQYAHGAYDGSAAAYVQYPRTGRHAQAPQPVSASQAIRAAVGVDGKSARAYGQAPTENDHFFSMIDMYAAIDPADSGTVQ